MISAIVLACAVVQQRAEVYQADYDVIVLAHHQTTVDWDDIAARADRDSLRELAANHEWYVVESDVAITVVDQRLLDLHQLATQVGLSSQLAQLGPERTGRISMQQLDESSRADLLLALAPGECAPTENSEDAFSELFVRNYGSGESDALAQRLIEQVRAWDAAGRPAAECLRIRAYPQHVDYVPSPSETVVEKRWTRLVLDWKMGGDGSCWTET